MPQFDACLFVKRFSCIGWKLNTRTFVRVKSVLKSPKLKSYGFGHHLFGLSALFGISFFKLHPFDRFLSPVLCDSPKDCYSTQLPPVIDEWTVKDLFDLILPETFTIFCAVLSLATFLYIGLLASAGERIAVRLRRALFRSLVYREMAYFDVQNSGKLLESITSDVQTFKSSFKQCISHGLKNTIQVVGSVYALLKISSTLTFTLMGSLPCVILVGSLMGAELRRLSQNVHLQNSIAASTAEETFTHIRSVKALALEENQHTQFCTESEEARRLNEKLGYGIGLFQGLSNLALNGIVLGVLYVGGHLISRDELKPGDLMSFLVTTQTVQRSLAQLSLLYGHVVRGNSALNRIFWTLRSCTVECNESLLFNRDPSLYTKLCDLWRQPGQAPQLCFDAVQFAYPSRPETFVLNELDMTIPAGKVVALVGQSGAGKSTVVSLIERFYDPSTGRIKLGDRDLRDFPLGSLRGQLVGYISQEPQIFNASIRENIRFGKYDATDVEVEEAARLANAHDFIVNQLPQGYDTPVGQSSDSIAGLSGGQRQRIAIARVILKNAPILLLDEATSALDAESEAQVQEALGTVMKGRTCLIIAHRLSTVRRADLILVMSHGKIVEQGTHQDLMAKRGRYYDLVQRQESGDFLS
ncbi:hypothetical protein P879_05655 [Paragonimus westermani]|uniref:Mitochondrial potassium channel ATP-binding subunit n=1 Tax=Paragonimus westermani TaxID=34504 RepID=A0A8T0DKA3_9TREM|nr:hypothetical protein P879_05655 [Paragonimus westermani]